MDNLKEHTASGLLWGAFNNGALQLLGLVFGVVLGRLLSPDDYGLMAMIAIFPTVASILQNSGFSAALINKPEVTQRDLNAVFWFNNIMGLSLYAAFFLLSPAIARFYHTPELTALCRYAFLNFPLASLSTVHGALLTKEMQIKYVALAGTVAVALSGVVAVAMAYAGMAYWALATQGIIFTGMATVMRWHYCRWRPSLSFDAAPLKQMFPFSVKILFSSLIDAVNTNVLNILLGRFFSKHDTGNYNQAAQWNTKSSGLVQGMVNMVAQPMFVRLHDEPQRQLNAMRKLVRFTAFIAFPLMFGFGLVAREFIVITITAKWLFSAELLRLLCVAGAVYPINWVFNNLIVSKGRSGLTLTATTVYSVLQIVIMIAIYPYGIRSMVLAYVGLCLVWVWVLFGIASHLSGYRLWQFMADTLPFALAASGTMIATYYATQAIRWLPLLLLCRVVLAAVLYYVVMRVAHAKILDESMQFLSERFKKKRKG